VPDDAIKVEEARIGHSLAAAANDGRGVAWCRFLGSSHVALRCLKGLNPLDEWSAISRRWVFAQPWLSIACIRRHNQAIKIVISIYPGSTRLGLKG
jgi:hypothetical protein